MARTPAAAWPHSLREVGLSVTEQLGAGMEGVVYALADGTVAKVWARQGFEDLLRLQAFYADLASADLPFATPRIHQVMVVDGVSVTIERRLTGRPLSEFISDDAPSDRALHTFVDVLGALRGIAPTSATRALSVLDEPSPFYADPDDSWPDALARLLARRVDTYGEHFRRSVEDFEALYARVVAALQALPTPDSAVLHGDLCTPNLLVDDNLRVVSVLDWGFLTTAGDPAFDASLGAGFFDMYGPRARAIDEQLTDWLCAEFGYSRARLHLYRAAYAIAGAHAYDPAGADGHFAWCVDQLNRPDLRASLR
ncbi:phosphotransferase family protein [Actinopolymorpha alba]|uniref:phosphotransferase family protein n=1 Tax=Actinopolymorpha alba TaxID=533267 RepID=UPI000379FAE4|nr:phosphotransferase [Actinopolymorpha alba]